MDYFYKKDNFLIVFLEEECCILDFRSIYLGFPAQDTPKQHSNLHTKSQKKQEEKSDFSFFLSLLSQQNKKLTEVYPFPPQKQAQKFAKKEKKQYN